MRLVKVRLSILITFMTSLAVLSASAYAIDKSDTESLSNMRQAALAKIDVLACLEHGGVVKNVCMMGMPACVQLYMDAGKKCTDSSECAGECRISKDFVDAGVQAVGSCSRDNDPCGCFQLVKSGVADHALCTD
ncbi:hypothetical protein [Shewanella violacea]|uniref:Secreted protein n=1 Tax=Shewanella violacea (strain JCM 10179 / CIP 106290 / LMG 19151 / DSS12) TaxID=637905 RepID=D4ZB39_SHEVD|nr:hypothetical protein [Shewanella violacea]BAJ03234.1 conserved hypothetical protein [Shewanella violacea DSS12]